MILPEPVGLEPQPGYIYLIRLDGMNLTEYKIGKTRDLKKRLGTLYCQTGLTTTLIAYGTSYDVHKSERRVQNEYYDQCVHGEFFKFTWGQLWHVINTMRSHCRSVVTDYSIPTCKKCNVSLVSRWKQQNFRCPCCNDIIPYDHYIFGDFRMLPYSCDELNDDDNQYINVKYDSIYNWVRYL